MQRARKIDEEERETRKKQEEEREALKRKRDEEMVCVSLLYSRFPPRRSGFVIIYEKTQNGTMTNKPEIPNFHLRFDNAVV